MSASQSNAPVPHALTLASMSVRWVVAGLTAVLVMGALKPTPAAAQANFGSAVAVQGTDVFVGQPANFYGPGFVYHYQARGGDWVEAARLFAADSARGDEFGRALVVSGDRLVVGATRGGDAPGSVTLFEREGESWVRAASLAHPGGSATAGFGSVLVMEGDAVLVGAPGANATGAVFEVTVAGSELAMGAMLTPSDLDGESAFGASLSQEGDWLLVGAPGAGDNAGAAVVFRRSGDGWTEDAVLTGDAAAGPESRFGFDVLLQGGRAFVGAPLGAGGTGTVLVFDRTEQGWQPTGQLNALEAAGGSFFGASLAGMGDEVWVGARGALDGDGAAYRFASDGQGGWSGATRVLADSANTAAWRFGFGSAIAAGTETVAIGMPTRDFGEGRVAVLSPDASGSGWQKRAELMGQVFRTEVDASEPVDCTTGTIVMFECSNVELVGHLPVEALGGPRGVWVNDVWGWSDGETNRDFALVSRRDGAAFVDVTDPQQPFLVGSLLRHEGSRPSVWRDIKVIGHHAFIVSDGAGAHGMQVFDLTRLRDPGTQPAQFTEDAHYDNIHSAHNVVANPATGFLYIVGANGGGETCGGGLHIVDARNPLQPTFAGCYNDAEGAGARGYTHDAQCVTYAGPDERYQGREVCFSANEVEINIADVTDKSNPVPIGRSGYPNSAYAHQGWLDESHRYFFMGDEADELVGEIDGTRTIVWDVSELDDPVVAREYIGPVQATDHNLYIRDNRVYMSNYGSGLRVVDITNPENPQEVAFFDSAPLGNNEAGMSSSESGAWSNYPFFDSGLVIFTSVREGLFIVKVKPTPLVP